MRRKNDIQPEPGTELFSSTEVLAPGAGDKWQIGFGPIDGAGAAWVLYHRRRDGQRRARKVLNRAFPARARLYVWLATATGARHAAAMLQTVGPLDDFYRRYTAGHPELPPRRAHRLSSFASFRPRERPITNLASEAKALQRSQ